MLRSVVTMLSILPFFVLFSLGLADSGGSDSCPDFITCASSESESSCPPGTFFREKAKVHGCCPGCVALSGVGQPCTSPRDCEPGLTCTEAMKCVYDKSQACEYYKRVDPVWTRHKYWNPVCLNDGTFAPKQCKGEKLSGKCFCVDRNGKRIFGEEDWSKAANMTCACSRLLNEMKEDSTVHCDYLGNFEPLQCDKNVCWCVSPQTGIPYTVMVHADAIISLPCYNREKVGVQYYRQCDSAKNMQNKVRQLLLNHGTMEVTLIKQNCNYDGSYHRVQPVKAKKRCAYINNMPLTEAVSHPDVDCNCAFDSHRAKLKNLEFLFDCTAEGSYMNRQIWNEKVNCVDRDGFFYSSDPRDC